MLVPVRSEHIKAAWPLARGFIESACNRGPLPCDPDDLRQNCEAELHQLWICEVDQEQVAAAVTGINDGACIWIAMGGDFRAAEYAIPLIEAWAKDNGCHAMRSFSRVGMVKRFPPSYRTRGVILERML